MISINSYLQNNGYILDKEKSNTKYSIYSIGVVDNENDFIEYNGNKMKLNKLLCTLNRINYYQAKKIIDNFIPLIPVELSEVKYKEPKKVTDNNLYDKIYLLEQQIVKLEVHIVMNELVQKTHGARGSWFLQHNDIKPWIDTKNYFFQKALDEALVFDGKLATDQELKLIPNIAEIRRKQLNKEALKLAREMFLNVNKLYKKTKKIYGKNK